LKILILDIETAPNIAHVWRLWKENVSVDQLLQPHDVLCWAAKWLDSDEVMFFSRFHHGQDAMIMEIYGLLNEADAVVTFNGKKFDIPHLNRTFLLRGMAPPKPFKNIDLLDTVKSKFRFPSNKLQQLARELLGDTKEEHSGHKLWVKCLNDDPEAWTKMGVYNRKDVILTERIYYILRPWISGHPNHALYVETTQPVCPNCGSVKMWKQGYAYTAVSKFQQYQCVSCGKWTRGRENLIDRANVRSGIADG